MKKRILALALVFALVLALTGCEKKLTRYEASFLDAFDTVTKMIGYAADEESFRAEADAMKEELTEYHQLYDIYNDYPGVNNLKTLNDNAGGAPVVVDQRIIDLLLECKRMYGRTEGRVNVAMGSVLSIWHEYRDAGIDDPEHAALPPMEALEAAALHTGIDRVIIDEAASTVQLADPEMSLDVGAIAKGFAAQRVTDSAKARGVTDMLLSVGGNVCALGARQDGTPWKAAVQDPASPEGSLFTVGVGEISLVTSGDYQRYYTVDGVRYHHIIDPDTLMPAAYFSAVSVLAKDSGDADALSTALYNLPYEKGLALAEREGVEVLWVWSDGRQEMTDGFRAAILE